MDMDVTPAPGSLGKKRGRPALSAEEKEKRKQAKLALKPMEAPKKRGRPALSAEEKEKRKQAKLALKPKEAPKKRGRPRKVQVTEADDDVFDEEAPYMAPRWMSKALANKGITDRGIALRQVTMEEAPKIKQAPAKPSRNTEDYKKALERHMGYIAPAPMAPMAPMAPKVAPAPMAAKVAPKVSQRPGTVGQSKAPRAPRAKKEEGSKEEIRIAREFEAKEAKRIAERDKGMSELDKEIRDQELFVKSMKSDMVKRAINSGVDEDDKKAIEEAIKKMREYGTYLTALKDLEDMMKEKRSKK
jgi:hypothetical protein